MAIILLSVYFIAEKNEQVDYLQEKSNDELHISTDPIIDDNREASYNLLATDIKNIIADKNDRYSIYFACTDIDVQPLIMNNQSRRSASMIKVFIMSYAMELARQNQMNIDETLILQESDKVGGAGVICGWPTGTKISIDKLLELMITESDNTATNMLIDYLGMDNINKYVQNNGYTDTVLCRKMMDYQSVAEGRENYTSVKDLGMFFTKLSNHNCVSQEYDEKMIQILLKQTDIEVLPTALPDMRIAHKTGELDGLYDDGGIVFGSKHTCVLVIMNDNIARGNAVSTMRKIAESSRNIIN